MTSPPPESPPPGLATLETLLKTERTLLRPFTDADVETIWPYVSDPEFPRMMSWAAHANRDVTREFIANCAKENLAGNGLTWAVDVDGRAVGAVSFIGISYQRLAWRIDRAELGYWLATPLWGQGYMTEVARAAIAFGFEQLRLHKITIGCMAENVRSKRVIEKVGFRFVGEQREDLWIHGQWNDHLRYELLRSEWQR